MPMKRVGVASILLFRSSTLVLDSKCRQACSPPGRVGEVRISNLSLSNVKYKLNQIFNDMNKYDGWVVRKEVFYGSWRLLVDFLHDSTGAPGLRIESAREAGIFSVNSWLGPPHILPSVEP